MHKHYLRQNPSPTSKSRIAAQFSSRNQFLRIDVGRSLYRFIKRRFKCAARRPLHCRIQSGFNNVAGRGLLCCIESLFQCTSGRFVPNIVQAANASEWSVFQSQNCDLVSFVKRYNFAVLCSVSGQSVCQIASHCTLNELRKLSFTSNGDVRIYRGVILCRDALVS